MEDSAINPSTSQDALTQLQQVQAGAQNPADILTSQQGKLGVPAAQQNVTGLRGAVAATTKVLNNIAPGVMGRTGNSLVTSAQANRQIQGESAPVATQLTSQTGALGNATQDYNTAEQQAESAANLEYQGQEGKRTYLQNIYDALFQREQSAQAQALEQQKLQEQIREADLSASTARATAASGASPTFGGNGTGNNPPASGDDPIKKQAQAAIFSLFGTNNDTLIKNTISAIQKSAGYGNPYDQLKLQLIQSLHPEYLVPKSGSAPLPGLGNATLKTPNAGIAAGNAVFNAIGLK